MQQSAEGQSKLTEQIVSEPIEFICDPELINNIPAPEKAIRSAPEWFRKLEREMSTKDAYGMPAMTAKACLPMTDAFSLGYMLPLCTDVEFDVPEDRQFIQVGWTKRLPFLVVDRHHPKQIGAPEPPFETAWPMKFHNPWRIKAPKGYSVLFTQPLSRPDLPFTVFSGMVDCDRFNTNVNIPFLWTGPPGKHTLKAGTPIAQMIPIRRDALIKDGSARSATEEELAEQDAANERKYGEESTYAREWRVKK